MGQWQNVYNQFFQHLDKAGPGTSDVLSLLDDTQELRFRRRMGTAGAAADSDEEGESDAAAAAGTGAGGKQEPPFWPLPVYTRRTLFERIVEQLRRRAEVEKREAVEETRLKLWHFLSRFEFDGGHTIGRLQSDIDATLLSVVDNPDTLTGKRDAMLTELGRRATAGNADIDPAALLKDFGLDAVPLNRWADIRASAVRQLRGQLRAFGYDPTDDVRAHESPVLAEAWNEAAPVLVVEGLTGEGKSWRLYGLAEWAACGPGLVVLVGSAGSAAADEARAAELLWQRALGRGSPQPIAAVARLVREVVRGAPAPWLTVLVDRVDDPDVARALATEPWAEWGCRLTMACTPEAAHAARVGGRGRASSRPGTSRPGSSATFWAGRSGRTGRTCERTCATLSGAPCSRASTATKWWGHGNAPAPARPQHGRRRTSMTCTLDAGRGFRDARPAGSWTQTGWASSRRRSSLARRIPGPAGNLPAQGWTRRRWTG